MNKDAAVIDDLAAPVASMVDGIPSRNGGAEAAPKTLKQLATHGSIWTIGGYGCSQVLRFGANVVLAKLLFPEAFGLMALVNGVIQGLVMFSDVGIGQVIIRHTRNDDPEFYNTIWTIQVLRGLLLTLLGIGLAWPIAQIYDPFLTKLISFVALTALIAGFNSTKLFTTSRDLVLARLTIVELTTQVVSIGVMVVFAWFRHSVWTFVIGAYVSVSLKLVLSHVALPGPTNRFCWRPGAVRELFRFGRWIFLSTMFTFLALQSDKLILGSLVSLNALGIYSLAFSMMATVSGVFEQLAGRVLMPAMVHVSKSSVSRFAELVLQSRQLILMAAAIAVADLILVAPSVFRLLYDSRYREAGWLTQLLCCGLWFLLLQRTSEASLLATDRNRALAIANAANFFVTVVAAPIGFMWGGIAGFIGGWTLGNVVAVIVLDRELVKHGVPVAKQDVVMSAYLVILCAAGFVFRHFILQDIPRNSLNWIADVSAATVITTIGAVFTFVGNRHFAFVKCGTV